MRSTGPILPLGEDIDPPCPGPRQPDEAAELRELAAEARSIRKRLGGRCKNRRAALLRLSRCLKRADRLAKALMEQGFVP